MEPQLLNLAEGKSATGIIKVKQKFKEARDIKILSESSNLNAASA